MTTKLTLQDFYSTTITEEVGIPETGDFDFTVATPPQHTNGFIVVSANNSTLRDVFYYHNVVGNRIYVRQEGRLSGDKEHVSGEPVQINDTANIFNYFSDMISQAFFVEKTGGLNVRVNGGHVTYNGNVVTVWDQALTLANNTTNYIRYDYATNTISSSTTDWGNVKAVATTLAGSITWITYRNPKESYIDFAVSITWALPSQWGNAGKVLFTDGTNVYWGNVVVPIASTSVAWSVEVATDAEIFARTITWGTWAPLIATPLQIQTLGRFWDGSDGNVTISTNTTLTRDMHYDNLTVNTGVLVDTNGFIIRVLNTCTLSGTAKFIRNGNNGANASLANGWAGWAALNTGTCGPCGSWYTGGSGVVNANAPGISSGILNPSLATTSTAWAAWGSGGSSSWGTPWWAWGTSGAVTQWPLYNQVWNLWNVLAYLANPTSWLMQYSGMPSWWSGWSGGGSGWQNGVWGGWSGGNGGIIILIARVLAGTGTIEAKGGNGGNGENGNGANSAAGWWGAGGSWGIVKIIYQSGTPYTRTLTGGTGGTGGTLSAGAAATAGATWTTGQSIIINV